MALDGLADEQLVTLVSQGERDALAALYDRHGKAVFGLVLHILRDPARAEEAAQDVFLSLWLRAATYQPQRGKFQSWLLAMAHHRAIDELRRARRQQATLEQEGRLTLLVDLPQDSVEKGAQRQEESEAVRNALAVIPAEQRQVIEMAYFKGYTQSEIAQQLQQPLGTVKTRMRLAMQKLRATLAPFQEAL